jgi:hypothetical protein
MSDATELLAYYTAAVEAARQHMEAATSYTAYNLALADYTEAKDTLRGAQQSLGTTALAA